MSIFEYLHIWLPAAEEDEDEEDGAPYPYESIQAELNRLGEQGWELVSMTPHWEWTYDSVEVTHKYTGEPGNYPETLEYEVEAPFSVPDYISGWYCTFKRPL